MWRLDAPETLFCPDFQHRTVLCWILLTQNRGIERQRCSPSVQMWQEWEPHAHTHTHTRARARKHRYTHAHGYTHGSLAAPVSPASVMCQNTGRLRQERLPQEKSHHPLLWPSGLPSYLPLSLLSWLLFSASHLSSAITLSITAPSVLFSYLIHPSLSAELRPTLIFLSSYPINAPHSPLPSLSLSVPLQCLPFLPPSLSPPQDLTELSLPCHLFTRSLLFSICFEGTWGQILAQNTWS